MGGKKRVWIRGDFVLMVLCFLVAVAWRIPVVSSNIHGPLNDEVEYHSLALRLSHGHGFTNGHEYTDWRGFADAAGASTAVRTPGFPLVLAVTYRTAGEEHARARIILALGTSLTAPALYSLCLRLFERRSLALLAGLLWSALLTSRRLTGSLLPEPLAALLLTLALLLTVHAERRRSVLLASSAGLVLGYAVLTRAFLLPVMIGPLAWLVVRRSRRLAAALLLAGAVIVGAWGVRNQLRMGVFTLTTQTAELWQGNNAWARGSLPGVWPPQRAYLLAKYPDLYQLDEVGRYRLFMREAINEVVSHPARILWLLPRKTLVFFSHGSYLGVDWLYAGLLPFSLLGAVCLAKHREQRRTLWLLGFPILGVLIVALLIFGDPRFRIPVDPLMVVLACVGLHGFASQFVIFTTRNAESSRKNDGRRTA